MYYPIKEASAEKEIKKSKFLSFVFPYSDEDEIKLKLKDLKKEHKKAAHVVHAYAVGNKDSYKKGMSDDREPPGTAGKPVLSVIEGGCYTNILIAVVRYFGGVKLGTGGLVKAYTESAAMAVKECSFKEISENENIRFSFSYDYQGQMIHFLNENNIEIAGEEYTEKVSFTVSINPDSKEFLINGINNAANGTAVFYKE